MSAKIVKEQVVSSALQLLDRLGMEGLTMRKVADALNVQVPSLYWHFANKDALFEAVADTLLEQVATTTVAGETWQDMFFRISCEVRQALLAHRDGARFLARTYPLSDNVARISSQMISSLKDVGADDRTAAWGTFSTLYFVIGFTIEEQAFAEKRPDHNQDPDIKSLLLRYPVAAQAWQQILESDTDEGFHFGLNMSLQGLVHHLYTPEK
ncbi:TetR/AcrR family transcriptional regulator C-terminal domain-containing protein [Komagataeibacter oboediens]|uniref:TetR family transcriptional regulator n=1 Tax=Komagataeibacter oboediens TaxID=65958 RepID=A0ABS5SNM9_9PROT|nr:TetR/AcrR family transcriptional regulator C-terminal domain-containing protein [Komagataeibacter oboediens]MBL7233094.1 TetR/AcrR family transcriptional regulator C-terminal domain-containing protein [Komagataeibacter oboediens]MBT0675885.1 TetR family transcriptional regulator [Komagataeibacter oboediens]MBT0677759.1 TetR family transcriptional regulator [Komagataeibacter oboediens]